MKIKKRKRKTPSKIELSISASAVFSDEFNEFVRKTLALAVFANIDDERKLEKIVDDVFSKTKEIAMKSSEFLFGKIVDEFVTNCSVEEFREKINNLAKELFGENNEQH